VLVTGADGFIGSHLVEALLERGANVKALALYNSFNNWGWLEQIPSLADVEVVSGDVRDPHLCRQITKGMDVVFHLAALIAIPYSYQAPESYLDTNIRGTLNMCQAALDNGCERIVHTSTSEVYGTAQYVPINEAHPLQPQSPYSASKIASDAMAMSYFNSFDLPLVTARPFNTYGPRQSARAFIPTIISQLAAGRESLELGDLRPTRDLNYVLDTCKGFIALAECDEALGKVVNIGTGRDVSVGDVAKTIMEIMGKNVPIVTDEQRLRPEKSEVFRLCCDNRRLFELTGFSPGNDLRSGLAKTVDWFTAPGNLSHYKADLYNV